MTSGQNRSSPDSCGFELPAIPAEPGRGPPRARVSSGIGQVDPKTSDHQPKQTSRSGDDAGIRQIGDWPNSQIDEIDNRATASEVDEISDGTGERNGQTEFSRQPMDRQHLYRRQRATGGNDQEQIGVSSRKTGDATSPIQIHTDARTEAVLVTRSPALGQHDRFADLIRTND